MKYALFLAVRETPASYEKDNEWRNFSGIATDSLKNAESVEILHEGCYYIHLDGGLRNILILSNLAATYHIETRVLFFDQPPSFVVTPG